MATAPKAAETGTEKAQQVKFLGLSAPLDDLPAPGDVQEFTVTARCTGFGGDERAQGGWQYFRKMRVLDVVPGKLTKAPEQDPPLPFDEGDMALGSEG